MIKLNNKNITYVALADTNNSIKAPKEIWYADTNNSVKLVYRRKDALIEGVDYEKYHWLKGDGSAYIDTDINIYRDTISTILYPHLLSGTDKYVWVSYNSVPNSEIRAYVDSNGKFTIRQGLRVNGTPPQLCYLNLIGEFDITIKRETDTNTIFTNNGIAYDMTVPCDDRFDIISEYRLLCDSAKVRSFRTDNYNLIPCKLLKPVPKWLDANGIRRQVGECGMIDLISGKFYGNVNSVGTFTVENYYERKEWLVGDGSAYIDTLTALSDSDTVEMKITGGTIPSASQAYKLIFGNNTNSYNYNAWVLFVGSLIAIRPTKTSSADEYRFQISTSQELTISQSTTSVTVNGTEVWSGTSAYTEIADKCTLFAAGTNVSHCYDGKVAYLRISNKLNLIPCTLTMDLPASMDANNIPRTKGTSGMWDLVSDRFYGNVANSGIFKAVNLAEGVDYEVHQWIIGDNVAYIDGLDYNLWTNTLEIKIGRVEGNCQYFGLKLVYDTQADTRSYFQMMTSGSIYRTYFRDLKNGQGWCGHFNISDMPSEVVFSYYNENGKAVGIINGVKTYDTISTNTITESVWNKYVPINTKDGNNIYTKLAKVSYIRELLPNNTYRSNLIPVKLLHSIPSKYDANGRARQAGECGMYDTVNDVFYGNVASSGSFTVEDDN